MAILFLNLSIHISIILTFLLLSGCAAIDYSSTQVELHAIGVYHGKRASRNFSTHPGKKTSAKLISRKIHAQELPVAQKVNEKQTPQIVNFGEVTVNVSISNKPLILAFSAYDRTIWTVNLEEDVEIRKIILSGYHQQKIIGIPETTLIEVYTYDSSPCEYCYQGSGHFYSYTSPPSSKLKKITGLDISSWQGRYTGEEFSIFPGIPNYSKK